MDRITFYSKDDLIVGYMLGKIEATLKKFDIHICHFSDFLIDETKKERHTKSLSG